MTPNATDVGLREVFRYLKDGRMRAYALKVVSEQASELWVTSVDRRGVRKSRKLVTFSGSDDMELFLEEIRRELQTGGWLLVAGGR